MKEKIVDIGSCLLALLFSFAALAAVAELSVCETPAHGLTGM